MVKIDMNLGYMDDRLRLDSFLVLNPLIHVHKFDIIDLNQHNSVGVSLHQPSRSSSQCCISLRLGKILQCHLLQR